MQRIRHNKYKHMNIRPHLLVFKKLIPRNKMLLLNLLNHQIKMKDILMDLLSISSNL